MSEWVATTLGDLERESQGTIQTGPFGSQLHMSDYSERGTPVVMPTNIRDLRIDPTGIARVSDEHVARLARHKLQIGDIVYSRRGDVEKCALVSENEEGWLCGTGCLLVRVHGSHVDARFLSYALSLPETRAWISQHAVGATMPNLNTQLLREVPVKVPGIEEQYAIAATLGALDDKIKSNRRKVGLIWELASSEWRALLSGGREAALGSILQLAYGKALPARSRVPGAVPVYGSSGITGWHDEALISGPAVIIGRKGTVGSVHWESAGSFPIDTTFIVEPAKGWPLIACYFALLGAGLSEMNSDSAVPGLNRDRALSAEVQLPELPDAQRWAQDIMPLIELASSISSEIDSLAQLRDSLLPELFTDRVVAMRDFSA